MFDIIIIADTFTTESIQKLRKLPLILLEVSFENSTKAKALNKAMQILPDNYEIALVLDADNIMEPSLLQKINSQYTRGREIIQCHRVAKNTNTAYARLDAVSEEINNYIFRRAHRVAKLSAALIGSGMAFDYKLFKSQMQKIKAIGGFDKELELNLLKKGKTIHYLEQAIVYDEKIQKAQDFKGQRRRWLSAQYLYLLKYLPAGLKELTTRGNIDFFDKVLQMALVPRILLLGILIIVNLIYLGIGIWQIQINGTTIYTTTFITWNLLLTITITSLLVSIPRKYYNVQTLKALLSLPGGFINMLKSLLSIKGANKKFIHTQHG